MSKSQKEPLLTENPDRYVMFPLTDKSIWDMYKKQMDSFWRAEEIDLSQDITDWKTLNESEKHFIKILDMKNILVIGGAGYVGNEIINLNM